MFYIITKNNCESCTKAINYFIEKKIRIWEINVNRRFIPLEVLNLMENIKINDDDKNYINLKSFIRYNSFYFKNNKIEPIMLSMMEIRKLILSNPHDILSFPIILKIDNNRIKNFLVGFSNTVLDRWLNQPETEGNFFNLNRAYGDIYCCHACIDEESRKIQSENKYQNNEIKNFYIPKNNFFQKNSGNIYDQNKIGKYNEERNRIFRETKQNDFKSNNISSNNAPIYINPNIMYAKPETFSVRKNEVKINNLPRIYNNQSQNNAEKIIEQIQSSARNSLADPPKQELFKNQTEKFNFDSRKLNSEVEVLFKKVSIGEEIGQPEFSNIIFKKEEIDPIKVEDKIKDTNLSEFLDEINIILKNENFVKKVKNKVNKLQNQESKNFFLNNKLTKKSEESIKIEKFSFPPKENDVISEKIKKINLKIAKNFPKITEKVIKEVEIEDSSFNDLKAERIKYFDDIEKNETSELENLKNDLLNSSKKLLELKDFNYSISDNIDGWEEDYIDSYINESDNKN